MTWQQLAQRYPGYARLFHRADRLLMSGERTAAGLAEAANGWIDEKLAPEHREAAKEKFLEFCGLRERARKRKEEEKLPEPSLFDRRWTR